MTRNISRDAKYNYVTYFILYELWVYESHDSFHMQHMQRARISPVMIIITYDAWLGMKDDKTFCYVMLCFFVLYNI